MTVYHPELAAIRFGTGLRPGSSPPVSAEALLAKITGPDPLRARYPITSMEDRREASIAIRAGLRALRDGTRTQPDVQAANIAFQQAGRDQRIRDFTAVIARGVGAEVGFRDRLTFFWADHFSVNDPSILRRFHADTYLDEAIRPHVAGRFADLLTAATLHPVMLGYLDQFSAFGPNSAAAQGAPRRGLNENLARELLELHTLGVGAAYSQRDVRELAELLAGLGIDEELRTTFRPRRSEPGSEAVLAFASPDAPGDMAQVRAVLEYLATHEATASHLARKLAVHFVSDEPDPDLVAALATRWRASGGDLAAVYETLLTHPAAWRLPMTKVKRPVELVVSSLRALDADPDALGPWAAAEPKRVRQRIHGQMSRMGQRWGLPDGPDGWPEDAAAWITPATLAARLRWSRLVQTLPGVTPAAPPDVLAGGLGSFAGPRLARAISGAETRPEAVSLILMSPEFQRR